MSKVGQLVCVEVRDLGFEADKRMLAIQVKAQSQMFKLSDMLVHEGAIRDLNSVLKDSARKGVIEYISSGKKFIKEVSHRKRKKSESGEE